MRIKGVAHIQLQVTTLIDIHKDITCFIATIPMHIVLDGFSAKGLVVGIGKGQHRTFGLVQIHGKIACLCQSATLPCAIVICLTISQAIGQFLVAAFVFHSLWFNLGEGNKMTELHAQEELGISGHCDGIVGSLRNSTRDINTSSQRTLLVERHVVLCLMSFTGNQGSIITISIQSQERLAIGSNAVTNGNRLLDSFTSVHSHLDGVVIVNHPIFVGGINGVSKHLELLFSLIGHIELNGTVNSVVLRAIGCQHIDTRSNIERIDLATWFAYVNGIACGFLSQTHGGRCTVHLHLYAGCISNVYYKHN